MAYSEDVDLAKSIAKKAHGDQKDKPVSFTYST